MKKVCWAGQLNEFEFGEVIESYPTARTFIVLSRRGGGQNQKREIETSQNSI